MSMLFHFFLFFLTGALIYYGMYYGTPKLIKRGVPLIYAFWAYLWIPVFLLLPFALVMYFLEGGIFSFEEMSNRFRLQPVKGQEWFYIMSAVVLTIIFDQILEPIGKMLAKRKLFAPPEYLPAPFNPLKRFRFPPREFFGVKLRGNWKLIVIFIPLHIIAMFSEELMWRGYILPIQETVFGSWAWVVNGLFWAWIVHAALKWHFIGMLPSMFIAPLVAQVTESTWASFFAHALGNAPLWVILIIGILQPKSNEVDTKKLG